MLEFHLRLFCERLKRVLAGEEGTLTLPDSTNLTPLFQNLLAESEIITATLLGNYEGGMTRGLIQLIRGQLGEDEMPLPFWQLLDVGESDEDVKRPDIWEILEDINDFVHESEEAIDTFFINIMQQQNSENESESSTNMALLVGLHSEIIDIRNQMQQLPPGDNGFDISERSNKFIRLLREGQPQLDTSEFERGREELFDLLIEGHPQLSVVAILDCNGFDKTAFAADTYNNNHVKFYFDCLAWVRVVIYDFHKLLDDIIKFVMPPSRVSVIIGEDCKLKKTLLRDYLTNKKYFIVLDDVYDEGEIWDDLEEVLPDNKNGSRVLITVTDPDLLASLEMQNGEKIQRDSVLVGGPLIRIKHEGWQFFILHYGNKPLGNYIGEKAQPTFWSRVFSVLELPFHLKVCCIYLCVFRPGIEISTRQLYLLWIAEGFIPCNSEETAEHYLKELIDRGFIHVSKRRAGGTIKACYVSGFPVYYSLFAVAGGTQFSWMRNMEEEPPANVKRCYVFEDLIEFLSLEHSDMCLQSFLNHSSESDHLVLKSCENFCKKFKHLRVLNLGSAVLEQFPPGLENLFLLKYLQLNIPSLKCLPLLLCTLLNLQTLEMPSSYIAHTPEDIWMMQKLMHLNFGSITLPAPPKNYSSSLKNLIFISALHPSSCTPDILGRVPNVQTLRISGDLSYYHSGVSKSLSELHKLECLKLVNEGKMRQLSRMVLSEYQFPPSLTELSLVNSELMEDPMPTLGELPHLQVLKLKQNSYSGRKLACVGSGGFPELKVLHLKSMYWLDEWKMGAGAMPKLESLIVNPCAYLRNLPEELWCIKSLCKLDLHWPQTELRQRLQTFENMDWRYDIQLYPYGI